MDLSNEQTASLENIKSLMGQIIQMMEGDKAGAVEEAEPEEPEKEEKNPEVEAEKAEAFEGKETPEEEEEEEKERKAKEAKMAVKGKACKDVTANDTAEDRVDDDQPEINEEAMKSIQMLMRKGILTKGKNFEKSKILFKSYEPDMILYGHVGNLAKVVKSLKEENTELRKCMENMLTGLGYADQIKKSAQIETAPKQADRSVMKAEIVQDIISAFGMSAQKQNTQSDVRKDLGDVMQDLFHFSRD